MSCRRPGALFRLPLPAAAAVILLLAAVQASAAGRPQPFSPAHDVTVMTQNLYPGFFESDVLSAQTPEELVAAAADAWQAIHDTDFPARADRIAEEIASARPDLVGLQEAFAYTEFDAEFNVVESIDFLDILLEKLADHGAHYRVAASETDIDVFLPIDFEGDGVEATDRGAFLVRTDLPSGFLRVLSASSGNFDAHIEFPVLDGSILIQRGWQSADVFIRGRFFRFVNTHLEDLDLDVQAAQVAELLAGPADGGGLPVILVGDFNSDANTDEPGYAAVLAGGFADTWLDLHPSDAAYTCCQTPDLLSPYALSFRYDVIFRKDGPTTQDIFLVGDENADRVPPPNGLWPSDHAGVVSTLLLPDLD